MRLRRAFNHLYRFDLGGETYALRRHRTWQGRVFPSTFTYLLFKHGLTHLLYALDESLQLNKKLSLTSDQQAALENRYSKSNERLGILLGRDLCALGYPRCCCN